MNEFVEVTFLFVLGVCSSKWTYWASEWEQSVTYP